MPSLAEIRSQYPQYSDMPDAALADALHSKFYSDIPKDQFYQKIGVKTPEPSSSVGDFFKSVPRGVLSGLSGALSASGQAAAHEMSQPDLAEQIPTPKDTTKILEQNVTGDLPKPEGRAGRFGEAIGETLGNPISYVGPGGLALKLGGATLSAAGGEAGKQLAEGTKAEPYAQIAGALLGGTTAAKTLGPAMERAVVPTGRELKDIAGKGYDAALKSGLELDPKGVGGWATTVEQNLNGRGFTGGQNGTAPKTMGVLSELQNPPPGATVGAANLDSIRKTLGQIAQETQPTAGGAIKATPDAVAASRALENLKSYTENIPAGHIVAGDAAAYAREVKKANANYAAGSRAEDFDARLTKAENATDRQIAGSLDAQIKQKAGQLLDRGARGLSDEEKAQLQLINSGGPISNTLRQLGRGGAGVIPLGMHVAGALATGGGSVPASLAIGIPLYAARKASEAITKSRAAKLAEMLAQRSPEYESRVAALPNVDTSPNKAAIARALLGAF